MMSCSVTTRVAGCGEADVTAVQVVELGGLDMKRPYASTRCGGGTGCNGVALRGVEREYSVVVRVSFLWGIAASLPSWIHPMHLAIHQLLT